MKTFYSFFSVKKGVKKYPFPFSLMGILFAMTLSSCTSYRGLPDHGGGKRFAEEQRMLSSSIKATIDNMDLSLLKGKKVKLVVDAVETSGSGRTTWSGFRYLNPNMNVREAGPGTEFTSVTYPMGYNIDGVYNSNNNITSKDIRYFEFMLKMRCRLEGVRLVGSGQEIELLVAVDVLGTNRSRDDHLVLVRDHLGASTEVTYCCIETKTGKVLLEQNSTGAKASYSENWMRLTNIKFQKRKLQNGLVAQYLSDEPKRAEPLIEIQAPKAPKKLAVQADPKTPKSLEVEVLKEDQKKEISEDELYQLGLDAVSRQDSRELRSILGRLEKSYPASSYIEVLTNKLSSL